MADLRRMRPVLGTYVEVGARGLQAEAALATAFERIELAQTLWSFQSPTSELSRLNGQPGQRVPLSRSTLRLLRLARALMRSSGGAFDCTVGGLLVAGGTLPDHGGLAPLPRGAADDIEIGNAWACLRRPIRLTLDGIAKGHAVDLAVDAMRSLAVDAGWINAGGDLRVFGDLTLPLQRRELDGTFSPLGGLRNAAVATSRVPGPEDAPSDDFPACIVAGSHGGTPEPGVWTVVARTAWRADGLTKVAATAAPASRSDLIRRLGGCLIDDMPAGPAT